MNKSKAGYKVVSLVAGVIGILALLYVVVLFMGNTPSLVTVVPVGIVAIVALPVAYVTNKLGRR